MKAILELPLRITFSLRLTLLALLLAFYFVAAFYPFDFEAPRSKRNPVDRLPGDAGLRFNGIGVASTLDPPEWIDDVIASGRFELALRIRTTAPFQRETARIFTVSSSHSRRNLTVAQRGYDLLVLVRAPDTDLDGNPPLEVPDVFRRPGAHDVSVVADSGNLVVSVDGAPRASRALPPSPFRGWNRSYRLALANELDTDRERLIRLCRRYGVPCVKLLSAVVALDDRAWRGILERAEITTEGSTVDYVAPGALEIPVARWVLVDDPSLSLLRWETLDNLLNLGAFVPLGLLLVPRRPRRPARVLIGAIAAALLISASIETTQFFLLSRVSSVTDLLTNTGGSALGALVGLRASVWRPKSVDRGGAQSPKA